MTVLVDSPHISGSKEEAVGTRGCATLLKHTLYKFETLAV